MAKVSATASVGIRVGLGGKKGFTSYDSISPHHSFSIERELSESLSDEELAEKQEELYRICEAKVTTKMNAELRKIKEMPSAS